MKRKLSPWCKEVKKTLIDRDMSVTELCGEVGMCRNYVTTTISNEPKSVLARDLGDCRDNLRNSQIVFHLVVYGSYEKLLNR